MEALHCHGGGAPWAEYRAGRQGADLTMTTTPSASIVAAVIPLVIRLANARPSNRRPSDIRMVTHREVDEQVRLNLRELPGTVSDRITSSASE
jgi:hypothetical protein